MTKTNPSAAVGSDELDFDSLLDTFKARQREITIAAIAVVAVVAGVMFWRMTAQKTSTNADKALGSATNALFSGNRPLAATELQSLAERYRDTPAGVQGGILLAQLDFEDAKWADGMKVLDGVRKSSLIGNYQAGIDALAGGAYADQKKYDDAVKSYQAAASAADFQSAKDGYRADQARILMLAGKKDEARKIWEELASRPDSPVVAEAKVRLGELNASAAAKN